MSTSPDPDVAVTDHDRIERERAFHDERFSDDSARAAAGRFYELVGEATDAYRRVIAGVAPGGAALEYGAGTGGPGLELAERGVRVTGIDISPVAVAMANEAAAEAGVAPDLLHYEVMDAEHLDLPDASFDLVFGSGILHHLDLARALPEVARVLAPGGAAVFFEPMGHNPAINLYRRLTPAMRSPDEHPLTMADLRMAGRHFGEVRSEFHVLSSFAAVPLRRWGRYQATIRALSRLDASLFSRLPWLRRFGWIVVVTLRDPVPSRSGAGA